MGIFLFYFFFLVLIYFGNGHRRKVVDLLIYMILVFQLWMRLLGRLFERRKDRWKDGTKTDNGICIQTMRTQNYFTFSMEYIIDT